MISAAEFKATVVDFIERHDQDRLPRRHELVLIGHHAQDWKRLRIKRPYTWVAHWMVRAFLRKWEIDRLAVVMPGDAPREFRVGFAARGEATDLDEIADRGLGNLLAAARREWSGRSEPLLTISGKPWPIALLVLALALDLLLGLQRIGLTLTGRYIWLPVVPDPISVALHVAYLVLLVATIHQLWRQTRAGYVLVLALAIAQLARLAMLAPLHARSLAVAAFIWWLVLALLYPAMIAICLLLTASAGGGGSGDKK